jgi:hypothetical protein
VRGESKRERDREKDLPEDIVLFAQVSKKNS